MPTNPQHVWSFPTRLFKAIYAGTVSTGGPPPTITRPSTNFVCGLAIGDSVGELVAKHAVERLRSALGDAGQFFNGVIVSGGAVQHTDVSDGSVMINGQFVTVPAGGAVEYVQGGGRGVGDNVMVIAKTSPGAGSFKIQTDNGTGGYIDEPGYTNVSADSAADGALVIIIPKPLGSYKVNIVGLSAGTDGHAVQSIGCAYMNKTAGGYFHASLAVAGLQMWTVNETADAIKSAIFNALKPDIGFMAFKDSPPVVGDPNTFPTNVTTFLDFWNSNVTKPMNWVLMGSTPENGLGYEVPNNAAMRDYALAHPDYLYFDGNTPLTSYAQLLELGWLTLTDPAHMREPGNIAVGSLLCDFLGINNLPHVPNTGSIRITGSNSASFGAGTSLFWEGQTAYSPVRQSFDGYDPTLMQGGRSVNIKDAAGNPAFNLGTGQNLSHLSIKVLCLGAFSASGPSPTPALRPISPTSDAGVYSSNSHKLDPAPFMASEYRFGSTTNPSNQVSLTALAAMPTTGTYTRDAFVWKLGRAVSGGQILLGWARLTSGSGHVLGTDWAECCVTTS